MRLCLVRRACGCGLTNAVGVGQAVPVGNFSVIRWMMMSILALCVSCSGSSDEVTPLATSLSATSSAAVSSTTAVAISVPAPTTTLSPWTDEQLEVIAAFEAAELAFRVAGESPVDPSSSLVAATHTLRTAEVTREILQADIDAGTAVRWPTPGALAVVHTDVVISQNSARIMGCLVDDAVVYVLADGAVLDDERVVNRIESELVLVEGGWLLDATRTIGVVAELLAC